MNNVYDDVVDDEDDWMTATQQKPSQSRYPDAVETLQSMPVITNPLDIRSAKTRLSEYDKAIDAMVVQAKGHEVTDEETNTNAVAMAGQAKAIANKVEKLRKSIVDAPNQFVKSVNNFAKQYTGKLAEIESNLKAKINRYQVEQQRARIEAQKRAEEEARKLQELVNKESVDAGIEPVQVVAPVIPVATITRTDNGSASLRKVWTWRLKDFAQVPDQFKVLNEKEINLNIKAGARNIPGLEIFEEAQTVIRSATIHDDEKF